MIYITGDNTWRKVSDQLSETVYGSEFKGKHTYMHREKIAAVVNYYCRAYLGRADYFTAACALGYYIAYEAKEKELYDFTVGPTYGNRSSVITFYLDGRKLEFDNKDYKAVVTAVSDEKLKPVLSMLNVLDADSTDTVPEVYCDHFKDVFSIRFMLGKRFGFFDASAEDKRNYQITQEIYAPFTVSTLVLAAYREIISSGFMYKMLMTKLLSGALRDLSQLISYKKSGEAKAGSIFYKYRNSEGFILAIL